MDPVSATRDTRSITSRYYQKALEKSRVVWYTVSQAILSGLGGEMRQKLAFLARGAIRGRIGTELLGAGYEVVGCYRENFSGDPCRLALWLAGVHGAVAVVIDDPGEDWEFQEFSGKVTDALRLCSAIPVVVVGKRATSDGVLHWTYDNKPETVLEELKSLIPARV